MSKKIIVDNAKINHVLMWIYRPLSNVSIFDKNKKKMSDDYTKGQEEMILHIKSKISKILENSEGHDILFDIIDLLKTLKPIPKQR